MSQIFNEEIKSFFNFKFLTYLLNIWVIELGLILLNNSLDIDQLNKIVSLEKE